MLTLNTLLDELGLTLLTGEAAAQRPVRWVHSTELLDPTQWLRGGELLLCTGLQLDDARRQRAFVARLVEHGIAALGFGTGLHHEHIPPALLATAREHGFPLFEVPYELPFIAIAERASVHLINEQYEALRRSVALQGRLERLVADERGLDEVVLTVAGALGQPVGVLSPRGETLGWHAPGLDLPDGERRALAEEVRRVSTRSEPLEPFQPDLGGDRPRGLALPVMVRDGVAPGAWLVGALHTSTVGDYERLILQQAVAIVALELMRRRVARDTERRLAGDVLAEALTGRLHADELRARLEPFGIGEQAAVLAFALDDPVAGEPTLDRVLASAQVRGLVATRGALLCAAVDAASGDPLELARRARAELGAELGPVRAAASRAAPSRELRRSFHEARCALEAVRLLDGRAPEVATHRDLGSFQLLLSVQDEDALRSYCASVLDPVEQGDSAYGDELLRSLDTFIEHNGNWERAAGALYCHRHTLRYRIRRVEDLTGRNLASARDRIELWLALRARELAR